MLDRKSGQTNERNGNTPFFSINIPIYNCEEYILDALKSVQQQSFSDWEIVIVDDGSTDSSLDVCLSQRIVPHNKIKVVSSEHGGQYSTRCKLIENSKGLYIVSLDADDMLIDSDALSMLATAILQSNCDIILFNATRSLDNRDPFVDYGVLGVESGCEISASDVLLAMGSSYALNNVCFKAYRRSLWKSSQRKGALINTEDRLQCAEIVSCANSCLLLDKVLYFYRANENSITNKETPFKFLEDLIFVEESIDSILGGYDFDDNDRKMFLCQIVVGLIGKMRLSCCGKKSELNLYTRAHSVLSQSQTFSSLLPKPVCISDCVVSAMYRMLLSGNYSLLYWAYSIKDLLLQR